MQVKLKYVMRGFGMVKKKIDMNYRIRVIHPATYTKPKGLSPNEWVWKLISLHPDNPLNIFYDPDFWRAKDFLDKHLKIKNKKQKIIAYTPRTTADELRSQYYNPEYQEYDANEKPWEVDSSNMFRE